ncbi:MAG: hypothetical protein ACI4IX_02780 [Acutalibacteraceae bacterium]
MTKTKSATKKALSLLLALLMLCSGLAISVSAATEGDEFVPYQDGEYNKIIVPKSFKKAGVEYPISSIDQITLTPECAENDKGQTVDGSAWTFSNLVYGTTYTVTAYNEEKTLSISATVTILKEGKVPAAPVPTAVKATSITVNKVDGCEYKLTNAAGNVLVDWSDTVEFKNLAPETAYTVSVRTKAVPNVSYASKEVSTTVTTKMTPPAGKPDAPVLINKTNTEIVVQAVEGVEFSINKGATWDASGSFTKLTPDTSYSIIARYTLNTNQEPGEVSDALNVKTNTRASYQADVSRCTFVGPTGKVYANESQTFTVNGDTYGVGTNAEFGDTRLVPQSFTAGDKVNADFSGSGVKGLKGTFTPGKDNAEKTMNVKVTYRLERFIGGNQWVTVKTVEKTYQVKVGPVNDTLNKIKEGLENIINFLLNDLPSLISKVIGSDIWGKLGEAIEGLLGMLNK